MITAPDIQRVRHELVRRTLTVARVQKLGSRFVRIVAHGAALEGFTSLGFDDHVKLIFADPAAGADAPPSAMRDFTPRRYDAGAAELWLDFYLHDTGPAAVWALQASVGQSIVVGGPRGSAVISPQGIDLHLLIGDETGMPAIARRLEELPAQARALVIVDAQEAARAYPLPANANTEVIWVPRSSTSSLDTAPAGRAIAALNELPLPPQGCFAWAALETHAARAIRRYLVDERSFDKRWIKAAGYWQRDSQAVHEVIADDE